MIFYQLLTKIPYFWYKIIVMHTVNMYFKIGRPTLLGDYDYKKLERYKLLIQIYESKICCDILRFLITQTTPVTIYDISAETEYLTPKISKPLSLMSSVGIVKIDKINKVEPITKVNKERSRYAITYINKGF